MLNFLDLLVVVFMVLAAVSLLALCLMFLVRNPKVKKVCFYIVAALGIYAGSIGIRTGSFLFPGQTAIAALAVLVSIAAIILVATSKSSEKKFKIGQLMATGSLIVGIASAFFI